MKKLYIRPEIEHLTFALDFICASGPTGGDANLPDGPSGAKQRIVSFDEYDDDYGEDDNYDTFSDFGF